MAILNESLFAEVSVNRVISIPPGCRKLLASSCRWKHIEWPWKKGENLKVLKGRKHLSRVGKRPRNILPYHAKYKLYPASQLEGSTVLFRPMQKIIFYDVSYSDV